MTTIYDTYYPAIETGTIDLTDVNFSAYVVDSTYIPDPGDGKNDVSGKIETLVKVLIDDDVSALTMSEIIEKITGKLSDEEKSKAAGFVVYDIASGKLCFYESFDNINDG